VRREVGMTSLNGLNYLIGDQAGTKTTEVYNAANNSWSTASNLTLPSLYHHVQPLVVKGKIYVIGGLLDWPGPSYDTVLMFDPANASAGWQKKAKMPTSRGAQGCAADGVKIYCAGGLSSTAGDTAIDVMEVYNTMTNSWKTLAPMPRDRDHFHAVILNGKFYAIGGRDTAVDATIAQSDVYDIATNTWSQVAPLPTPRGGYSATVLQGRILVIGGEGKNPPDGTFPHVEEYDPARNTWRRLADLPTPRHGTGIGVNSVENSTRQRVYISCGGPKKGGTNSKVHEVFTYLP